MLPATISPPAGNAPATSKRRMSACTTSTLPCADTTSCSAGISARSNSTATTRRHRAASPTVSVPTPAPTSSTSSSSDAPDASATESRRTGSTRKFWPRRRWRVIRWRRRSCSRSPARAGSIGAPVKSRRSRRFHGAKSLHLLKQTDRVRAFLVAELLEADAAEPRHDFRRVDQEGRPVRFAHPLLRVAVWRVGLQEQPVGRAPLHHLPQVVTAGPGHQAGEGKVEADVEKLLRPLPVEREVMHDAADAAVGADHLQHLIGRTAVVDPDRQLELGGDREHLVQALDLQVARRSADVLEVEADLADDDDHLVARELPQRLQVGFRRLQGMVSHPCPHLFIGVSEADRVGALLEVHANADQTCHPGGVRLLHHLGRVAELVEVEVRVDDDLVHLLRSEERRVGKECRSRWWPCELKKKKTT